LVAADAGEIKMESTARFSRYIGIYSGVLALAIVISVLVVYAIDFDPGSFVSIAQTVVAACVAGVWFVRDNRRLPNSAERWRLAWLSLAAGWTVSVAALALFMGVIYLLAGPAAITEIAKLTRSLPVWIWGVIFLFVSAVHLGLLHLSYGHFTKILTRNMVT
jgi:hypothetical protein